MLITPLAQGFEIELTQDKKTIDFVQILLTIVILAVSIILSMANFAVRGERIHNCGMELNSLGRKVYPKVNLEDKDRHIVDEDLSNYLEDLSNYIVSNPAEYSAELRVNQHPY